MTANWPEHTARIVLDEVDSTNTYARDLAMSGEGPLWVMVHDQTFPRGRRGRAWSFQKGNFAASFLCWPERPVDQLAQMSFVTALALAEVVGQLTDETVTLKWPNDLLVSGRKLSGILLETVQSANRTGLIIGIGVNLKFAPSAHEIEPDAVPAIALSEVARTLPTPEQFLDLIASSLSHWQEIWLKKGFEPIREAWLTRAIGLGEFIVARLPNDEHKGIFEDIDVHGSLMLRTSDRVMVLPAAHVYFPNNNSI